MDENLYFSDTLNLMKRQNLIKRKVLGLSFILGLVLSAVAGALMINSAVANPIISLEFPTEPITTPPTIVVHAPVQNQNYDSNDVWLNFTIIKPETWIRLPEKYGGVDEKGNPVYVILGNVTSVYYVLDGEGRNVSVRDQSYFADAFPNRDLNFSTKLTLTKGAHNIVVGLEADSYYYDETNYQYPFLSSVVVNGSSEIVNFTVLQEPFPTVPVAAATVASVAVAGVGLLVYFRERKHQALNASPANL